MPMVTTDANQLARDDCAVGRKTLQASDVLTLAAAKAAWSSSRASAHILVPDITTG